MTKTDESLASRFPLRRLVESACLVSRHSRSRVGYNGLLNCRSSVGTNDIAENSIAAHQAARVNDFETGAHGI